MIVLYSIRYSGIVIDPLNYESLQWTSSLLYTRMTDEGNHNQSIFVVFSGITISDIIWTQILLRGGQPIVTCHSAHPPEWFITG